MPRGIGSCNLATGRMSHYCAICNAHNAREGSQELFGQLCRAVARLLPLSLACAEPGFYQEDPKCFESRFDSCDRDNEPLPALPRCRNDDEFEMVRRQCTAVACDDQDSQASISERLS